MRESYKEKNVFLLRAPANGGVGRNGLIISCVCAHISRFRVVGTPNRLQRYNFFSKYANFWVKKNEGKGAFFYRSYGFTERRSHGGGASRPSGLLAGTTARSEQEAEHCPSGQAQI